jgi:hypothetical protein
MKNEFYQNVFLFPVPLQFLKLSFRKKDVFQLLKHFISGNDILSINHHASYELIPVKSNFAKRVCVPLPAVSLAPI